MKKQSIFLLFIVFLSVIVVQDSKGGTYPVLELDEDISGVIGEILPIKLTAFSEYPDITIRVFFMDTKTNSSFLLFNKVYEFLVNEWIYVNCSTLLVDSIYELTITCTDAHLNMNYLKRTVYIDITDPIINHFSSVTDKFGFGDSLLIDYEIEDNNFAYADIYIENDYVRSLSSIAGSFELSYLDFNMPQGYTSYVFIIMIKAYDKADNSASRSFTVIYADEYRAETLEERLIRIKRTAVTISVVLFFYLLFFVGMFLGSKKFIALYFYNKKEVNEAIY